MSLFRRTEKRALDYQEVWGSGTSWSDVHAGSIETALGLVPVYAAVRILSESIASLPIQAFRREGDKEVKIELPPLLADPTMFGGVGEWMFRFMSSRLLRGNCFGLVTEANAYGPTRLEWLHPDEVELANDERAMERPMWKWNGRQLPPDDLVHVPYFVLPGRVLGLSPIAYFKMVTDTGVRVHEYGRDWFRNRAHPSAILETDQDVTQPQAKRLKDRFKTAASNQEPVVMGGGVKYRPIQVSPGEAEYLRVIKATATQIAAIYGVKPEDIGGESGDSMTYSNIEHEQIHLATRTLRPHIVVVERAISRLLPEKQFMRFNVDAIIRTDIKARYEAHATALEAGWLNPDEVRELERRDPIPGGDGKIFNWPKTAAPAPAAGTPALDEPAVNGNGVKPPVPVAAK